MGVSINAGRDVETGDIAGHDQIKLTVDEAVKEAGALLNGTALPLPHRAEVLQDIRGFQFEARQPNVKQENLDRYLERLEKMAPAVAQVLAAIVPSIIKAATGG